MQSNLQLNRKQLPSVNSKQQPVSSYMQIIRLKKVELSKQLEALDTQEIYLPVIHNQKQSDTKKVDTIVFDGNKKQQQRQQLKGSKDQQALATPSKKFRTILDQMQSFNRSRFNNRDKQKQGKQKAYSRDEKPQAKIFVAKNYSRTKTEVKVKESKKSSKSRNTTSIQKQGDQKEIQNEEPIQRFCAFIEQVPRNIKQRNEENLTKTIVQLQKFNPFFNRNNRIINVCLMKMGKIVFKQSPLELYWAGEELDYFYIILLGRIKIIEGTFKRICETGETILEQIVFNEIPKRLALERAKVLNSAYLLQMRVEEFNKLKEELIRHGLRLQYQQMESVIKRNYIIKNWMRNKKR